MSTWEKQYLWEAVISKDVVVQQLNNNIPLPDIEKKYGKVKQLALIPRTSGLKKVLVNLPRNTIPVYFRRVTVNPSGVEVSLKFCIGWEVNNVKFLLLVDSVTGDIEHKIEF